MGNITNCCDSNAQMENVDGFGSRLFRSSHPTQVNFPPMPNSSKQLLLKTKQTEFYRKDTQPTENKERSVFLMGEESIVYEGEVEEDYADGNGCISFPDGSYFEGTFRKNCPINGIFLFKENSYYVGDIENFQACGKGCYENLMTGYKYEGEWKKNLPHGFGTEKYPQNEEYSGQFVFGKKFGQGTYKFNDGKVYEGTFYNNQSDGYGKLFLPNDDRYEGEWKLGCMHGKGTYYWKNGEKYIGQYVFGKKHGKGEYHYYYGYKYEGEWEEGIQHGSGTIREGFDEVEGQWKKGSKIQ